MFNSHKRENSVENKVRFQGQENVDDLGLNWDSFKWRNHQPDIGRFFNVDPISEKYYYNSPYAFSENKVVAHVELEGLEAYGLRGEWEDKVINKFKGAVETTGSAVGSFFSAIGNAFKSGVNIWGDGPSSDTRHLPKPRGNTDNINKSDLTILKTATSQKKLGPTTEVKDVAKS